MSKKKTKYSVPINNHLSLLQETWDKAFQEGYAKGRVRCLEQHCGKELQQARVETIDRAIDETKKHGGYMSKEELTKVILAKLK